MIIAVMTLIGFMTALLQIGAVPTLFPTGTEPLLPIALMLAWAALRDVDETWPIPLMVSLTLGVASQERVGWFMIAFLPTAALALAMGHRAYQFRLSLAPVSAGVAAILYLKILTITSGHRSSFTTSVSSDLTVALWTAVVAAILVGVLYPIRNREWSLFE